MLELFEFDLPFHSPFKTASAAFKSRKGILLHFKNDTTDIVTEASPLPGFSKETFSEVKQVLLKEKDFIEDFLGGDFSREEIRNLDQRKSLNLPSVQFALSFLALSVLAGRKGKNIYDLFRTIPAESIKVNDVIGYAETNEMKGAIERSIEHGFKVIKIKAPHPVDELASLLSTIHKTYHGIRFRLDANQSWPFSTIEENCNLLQNLPIEYVEEPTQLKSLNQVSEIQKTCSLPLALDESVATLSELKNVLEEYPDLVVVIKPTLLGNILKIHETISAFRGSFKYIVCTTALEASIGRSMVAAITSITGDPTLSHGLNTGHLFANDLLPDFEIKNGSLYNHHQNAGTGSFQNIKTTHLKKLG